jgi:cbb3-type cytochrome oxidase subunit 3
VDIIAAIQWLGQYSVVPVTAVFVLMVVATYWPGRRREMERNARIPLDDDR